MRLLIVVLLLAFGCSLDAATVSGNVSLPGGGAASGARVTLFTPDTWFFRETRTTSGGAYSFANVPAGDYRLGVALRRSGRGDDLAARAHAEGGDVVGLGVRRWTADEVVFRGAQQVFRQIASGALALRHKVRCVTQCTMECLQRSLGSACR